MTPEFFREQQLMRGAVGRGTPNVVTPATVFLSQTFASATPDTATGGSTFVAGYEIARSGDTALPVTVGVALTGRPPTPLVAGDVLGGLSDVTYTIPAGQSRLPLSVSFPAQDLLQDHYGRVQLHNASVAIAGTGRFDFVLFHNSQQVIQGDYALSPDYAAKYAKHQAAGADSLVTQLGAGLGAQLKGGSVVADDTNGLGLWAKRRTTLGWDVSFTTKKLDATTPTSGALTEELMLVYFGCTGNGGSFPTDVSAWPATTNPYSHNYRANLKGAALTLYNQTDANATVAHAVALGVFKGDDTRTNVTGLGTIVPFVQNTVYTWTIKRRGETITVSVTDGATTWADSFTAPPGALLSTYADAGNIGLIVSPQRQIEVGDLTVRDGIAGTPPYALAPDWTQRWVQHTTPTGVVQQLAAGVQLNAGDAITDDNVVIVSKDIHTSGAPAAAAAAAPLAGWELAPDILTSGPSFHAIRTKADVTNILGAPLQAGHQYVVMNNINGGGATVSIGGGGAAGNMAWVRGVTEGRDRTAYPVLSGFEFHTNCVHTGFRCITFDGFKGGRTGGFLFYLQTGTGFCQWESNWYKNQFGTYSDALHVVDTDQRVSDLLFAFNDYRADAGQKIAVPFFLALSAAGATSGHQQVARVRMYANHTHGMKTGQNVVTGGGSGNGGRTKWIFWGQGPVQQGYTNVALVDYNLFTQWDSIGGFVEDKYPGADYRFNTFEHGARADPDGIGDGNDSPLCIKHRYGRTTLNGATSIDASTPTSDVYGNLWVWKTGVTYATNEYTVCNVRDGYSVYRGNWGVTISPGQQPAAWGTQALGHLTINVLSADKDWPTSVKGDQECGGKASIGATYGTVQIGNPGQSFDPDACRVAPIAAGRADRNKSVSIVVDRPGSPTDQTTPVSGADVSIVPHRMQAPDNGFAGTPEVGCAAWNAAAFGGGGGGGGGDLDVSFDYTCTATPATTDGNGCASLFYCHMVGQGAYPADVSAWSAAQWGAAGDVEYQPNATWWRFTFNTQNTPTPSISNKARMVVCSGGVLTRPTPNEAQADFFFPVGTTYRLRCRKNSNDFSFTQTDAAGNVKTQTWTDATAGAMNTGNFLWRFQPARHGKIENLTVA
jgi:hypothetical protein